MWNADVLGDNLVKPTSVAKLIERGWAIHVLPDDENS